MDTIFDPLRKTEVALTPEEQVRRQYRADIVVFGRDAAPLLLVECKAPGVRIDREVIEQGIRYNRVLNVKYMMFTNGEKMYFCERTGDGPEYRFLPQIPEIKI